MALDSLTKETFEEILYYLPEDKLNLKYHTWVDNPRCFIATIPMWHNVNHAEILGHLNKMFPIAAL